MRKRFLSGRSQEDESGKNLPLKAGSRNQLDPDGVFAITLPISFQVDTSPLATFSERAIRAYRTAAIAHLKLVKDSIFHPQQNGSLRIYPPAEDEGDKKRRN